MSAGVERDSAEGRRHGPQPLFADGTSLLGDAFTSVTMLPCTVGTSAIALWQSADAHFASPRTTGRTRSGSPRARVGDRERKRRRRHRQHDREHDGGSTHHPKGLHRRSLPLRGRTTSASARPHGLESRSCGSSGRFIDVKLPRLDPWRRPPACPRRQTKRPRLERPGPLVLTNERLPSYGRSIVLARPTACLASGATSSRPCRPWQQRRRQRRPCSESRSRSPR